MAWKGTGLSLPPGDESLRANSSPDSSKRRESGAIQIALSDDQQVDRLIEDTVMQDGPLDILTHDARLIADGQSADMTMSACDEVLNVNLGSMFFC